MDLTNRKNNKEPVLDMQDAQRMLEHIFEQCAVEPNSVPMEALSAYTVYRKERFRLQRRILGALLVLFLLLPSLFIRPVYTVDAQDAGDRKLPVYTVKVSSLLPVHSVRAQQKNRTLPVYELDRRTYTVEPTRNGDLRISVSLINRQEEVRTLEVSGVDRTGPALQKSSVEGGQVFLYVEDDGIGVDYSGIYALSASGEYIMPLSTDEQSGTVVFSYPTEVWDVYIPDHIGNTLHLAMKFK